MISLEELYNVFHEECFGTIFGAISVSGPGDVRDLKKCFKKAVVFERIFKESKGPELVRLFRLLLSSTEVVLRFVLEAVDTPHLLVLLSMSFSSKRIQTVNLSSLSEVVARPVAAVAAKSDSTLDYKVTAGAGSRRGPRDVATLTGWGLAVRSRL